MIPQSPQFCLSLWVSTHLPSHTELPEPQETPHCPSVQVAVPGKPAGTVHTFWHAPQFFTSERGSMQAVPQVMYGL